MVVGGGRERCRTAPAESRGCGRAERSAVVVRGAGQCAGTVEVVGYGGADTFVLFDCGPIGQVNVRIGGESAMRPGDNAGLAFAAEHVRFFGDDGAAVR